MPVGNDVVDLRAGESRPDALHPRWDGRVFGEEELRQLGGAPSRHRMRWALWAAKESAFKAGAQVERGLSFIPRDFAVRVQGVGRAVVDHVLGRFEVTVEETADWIHAVAVLIGAEGVGRGVVERAVRVLSGPGGVQVGERGLRAASTAHSRHASADVRALAAESIARGLDLDPKSVEVPMGGGIPFARWCGRSLPLELSLSHHGRFVACAWRPAAAPGTPA